MPFANVGAENEMGKGILPTPDLSVLIMLRPASGVVLPKFLEAGCEKLVKLCSDELCTIKELQTFLLSLDSTCWSEH